ncbi:uncharacterized protein LOC111393015 [Olea europaea var. sylvestris]|uniref:uncharacterized protein LOC111393015 n=1 Tax=Olea europaea var. sylvestris TaxID=158386 RepID=UPI000C1D83B7|nr:uncharacterized protein LOC111393015 [Olea europaea var. sylvestris]
MNRVILHMTRANCSCPSLENLETLLGRASHVQLSVTSVGALFANFQVRPTLIDTVRETQTQDPVLSKLKEEVSKGKHTDYTIRDDGALVMRNRLCVPDDSKLKGEILEEAHSSAYAMHSASKPDRQKTAGLLQTLPIPKWKLEHITMNFLFGLPRTQSGHDGIWIIVDRLTKTARFLPIKVTYSLDKLAKIYVNEIISLYGTPKAMGTKFHFSTAFHPQIDGQSERTIQTLEDMLRACEVQNSSMLDEVGERKLLGLEYVHITAEKVKIIKEKLKTAQDRQKNYADRHRRYLEFDVGDRSNHAVEEGTWKKEEQMRSQRALAMFYPTQRGLDLTLVLIVVLMVGPTFSWYLSSAHTMSGYSSVTRSGVCRYLSNWYQHSD